MSPINEKSTKKAEIGVKTCFLHQTCPEKTTRVCTQSDFCKKKYFVGLKIFCRPKNGPNLLK